MSATQLASQAKNSPPPTYTGTRIITLAAIPTSLYKN
jgi:hypothetical protein